MYTDSQIEIALRVIELEAQTRPTSTEPPSYEPSPVVHFAYMFDEAKLAEYKLWAKEVLRRRYGTNQEEK